MDLIYSPTSSFQPQHQPHPQQPATPFKPVPKPRRSLMNNGNNHLSAQIRGPIAINGASFNGGELSAPIPPPPSHPPPLPPRPSMHRRLSAIPSPSSASEASLMKFDDPPASNNMNNISTGRIYPVLEDLYGAQNIASQPKTNWPTETIFNEYDDPNVFEYPSSSSPFANTPVSRCDSFVSEPFGEIKSEGESICYSGWVHLQGVMKQRKRGWAVVRANRFFVSNSDESASPFLGPFDMDKCVYSGRTITNSQAGEITLVFRGSLQKKQRQKFLSSDNSSVNTIRFTPEENAEHWLALFAQCLAPDLLQESTLSLVECCGKLWMRQGISGVWNAGWAVIHGRVLHYWAEGTSVPEKIDIRKIFLVKQKDVPASDWCNRIEQSSLGPFLIAMEGSSLYLQSQFDQCTSLWLEVVNAELAKETDQLEEFRQTTDDIPVIVDKCIGLISTYGMFQTGIYRKNGSAAEAKRIMQAFREDPYTVHLRSPISDETVNAVADVLRTFFRQLREPLVPTRMHSQLYEISGYIPEAKAPAYRALISSLPKVHYKTLRKLLGHLQEIVSHENVNLASLDNISKVFGPTLFNVSHSQGEVSIEFYNMATRQTLVMHDLIFLYCEIFDVSAEELMAKCKLDVVRDQRKAKNPANGLLVPIHLFQRDNKCFNVQSEWTAAQVVSFKIEKLPFVSHCESYALFEVIRDGQLERRVGAGEALRSIVLTRWLDWEEHQGYLLLKKDTFPFKPQTGRAFAEDLKLAEPGSSTFKTASLRIEQGTHICQYSKSMKRQNEWKVDELLWFWGAETERKCPHPFALTFFVEGERKAAKCKGRWPGYCAAFRDETQRLQWLNQVLVSTQEYLPSPIIQI